MATELLSRRDFLWVFGGVGAAIALRAFTGGSPATSAPPVGAAPTSLTLTLSPERAEATRQFEDLQSFFIRWLKPDWNTLDSIVLATMPNDELALFLGTHRRQSDEVKVSWVDIESGQFVYNVDFVYNPNDQVSRVILQTSLAGTRMPELRSLFDLNRPQGKRVKDLLMAAFGTSGGDNNNLGSGGLIFRIPPEQPWNIIQDGSKIKGVGIRRAIDGQTVELTFQQTGEATLTVSQAPEELVVQPVRAPVVGRQLKVE